METSDADKQEQSARPVYRVEIHLYSGKTLGFNAHKFEMERRGGTVTGLKWEFTSSMLQPGVYRPLLELLDTTRIEAVTVTELPQ